MNSRIIIISAIVLVGLLIVVLIIFRIQRMINVKTYSELLDRIENIKFYNTITNAQCEIPYPIYYINMDKDINRRQYMETQLQKITKEYHRIRGFNGYSITNEKKDTVDGISFINHYAEMTKPEIGCTISHLLSIKAGYESSAEIVMICEDDVMFDTCSLSPPITEIVKGAPNDWELLQLIVIQNDLPKIYSKLKGFPDIEYIKRKQPEMTFWTTACYLINRKGMNKVMSIVNKVPDTISIVPIRETNGKPFPLYGQADTYILDICTTYSVLPCPFLIDNTALPSTIHDDHTPHHLKNSLLLISKFNEFTTSKQLQFTKTLLDMDIILSENKQTYFLTCGTALGAVREGKFIEYDADIDLGIFASDFNPVVESKILEKFKLKHRLGSIEKGYELSFTHPETNISIDIFLHYREPDYVWCPSFFSICDKAKNKMCRWKYSPFTLKSIKFMSNIFNIPFPVDKYLAESYGPDWKIPKQFSYNDGLQGGYTNLIYDDFGKEGKLPDKMNVWQYWENKPDKKMPEYIKLCMNSVKKASDIEGLNYIRLSPDNLSEYINVADLPANWYKLDQIAHKADYVRAIVLYKYGGLWLDADTLVQSQLKPLLDDLQKADWVVFADEKEEFSIGIMAIRKESPLLKQWIEKMTEKLANSSKFEWTELGYDILYPLWKDWKEQQKTLWRAKIYEDQQTCFPLLWNEWEQFFMERPCDFLYRKNQPVIVFYNALFPNWFKELSEREFNDFVKSSQTVIADLFRRSGY